MTLVPPLNRISRKIVAWPMFWLTYCGGHAAFLVCNSKLWPEMEEPDFAQRVFDVFYDCYQGGMRYSLFWSDWGDLKQWSEAS